MPELEYTVEVTSPLGWRLPDGDQMQKIIHEGLGRWYDQPIGQNGELIDVQVTSVSDDL